VKNNRSGRGERLVGIALCLPVIALGSLFGGDLLLPKPKASAERSEEDAALLAEDTAPSPPQVAEERLGQRMRRLLEHYVGSEARSDRLAGRRLSRPPSGPPAL
jgi:hypothetical protein